ncbi:MAG TPA: type II secretion system protein [Planctomycetota bacterium]|nr:type II secretion system protein [Planctomycetota bacterium]
MQNALHTYAQLARVARRGFTLIELLAVIMIIGILSVFLIPRIPEAIDAAKVTACDQNLKEIYKGLMLYDQKFGNLPSHGGVRFFTDLVTRKVYENVPGTAKKLTCPGVKTNSLASLTGLPPEQWFADAEAIDGDSSSYAGRDIKEYPLRKFPGSGREPLVADDNDPEMNHRTQTLVLYDDGNVERMEIMLLVESGELGEDESLIVGPDSQVEVLRKLSLD